MSRVAIAFALVGMLAAPPLRAADILSYQDDRLTMRVENMPLGEVLEQLKAQSGAELRGEVPAGQVTATFDAIPLREALERLLGDRSFTLTYGDDGRLKAIELKGGPQAAPAVARQEDRPARAAGRKERWEAVGAVFNDPKPVPVDGVLAELTGKNEAGWDFVLRTAINHEDPEVRLDAARAGMRAVDQSPEMQQALLKAFDAMDTAELAQFARAAMGGSSEGAEALTKFIARNTRTPEFRTRARAVLRQIRLDARSKTASAG
jgi:hypothetical protein